MDLRAILQHWPTGLVSLLVIVDFILLYLKADMLAFVALNMLAAIPLVLRSSATRKSLERYWTVVAILFIMSLSVHVRILDYNWPYLRNIDSYAFYRDMELIIQYGDKPASEPLFVPSYNGGDGAGDLKFVGLSGLYLYQRLGAYSYLAARQFIPSLELWRYLIYFPALLVSLAAIPMYYIGKLLYDRKAGVLAAFFILFDISIVSRSLGGDPDSDAIVIIVPLVVLTLYLITYRHFEKIKGIDKMGILYGVLVAASLVVWHQVWGGYWYSIWLITGFLLGKLAIDAVQAKNGKQSFMSMVHQFQALAIILAAFFVLDYHFVGIGAITTTVTGPFEYQAIKSEEGKEFPNVYVSVAELQESGSIKDIVQRTSPLSGAPLLLSPYMLTFYALIYLSYACLKQRKHLETFIILFLWFVGPLLATLVAVRFTILFAAPMALGSGILLSKALRMTLGQDKTLGE
ncbi:MAG: hypothetical protein HYY37_01765 [Candidatus Aenigmarchaeota archaeon]|nr:hypothetical protein [Candidatus Aenigmarchaeota archaeon]